jgi:hypothetical protein
MFLDGLTRHNLLIDAAVIIGKDGSISIEHVDGAGLGCYVCLTADDADELAAVLARAARVVRGK